MGVNNSRVFIVQQPVRVRRDPITKEVKTLEPVFDVTPAAQYGTLELLLDSGLSFGIAMKPVVQMLNEKLRDFTDDDYILPTGDPCVMGIAIAIAAKHNGGRVAVLRWDKRERQYIACRDIEI